ncbi:hypothetical protein SORBI_3002G203300 [Sorghum bicolor]|uniref:Uncharacterized protein n=1 Tax=Sorghum bicolor TaxID=4558 RepID=A0A1W0W537_SORBI|nr:hypothetical protein SORBI_3002G203300 [Sorghum bicolor]
MKICLCTMVWFFSLAISPLAPRRARFLLRLFCAVLCSSGRRRGGMGALAGAGVDALSPPRDLFCRMHPSPLVPHPSISLRCAPMMRRRHAGAAVSLLASVAVVALFVLRRLFVSLPETLSCRPLGLR